MKHLFDKQNKYSVRKLSVGLCSVVIGLSFLSSGTVYADSQPSPASAPTVQISPRAAGEETGEEERQAEEVVTVPVLIDKAATVATSSTETTAAVNAVDGNSDSY